LLHLIDVYSEDAGKAYRDIRGELEKYSAELAARPEIVALTKCEGLDEEIVKMQMAAILKENPDAQVLAISSSAHQGLTEVLRELWKIIDASKIEEKPVVKEAESDIPVITLEAKEQKRRARHQKYQLGERNSIQQLDPQTDYDDYLDE
jgi:GTP-binding protein